MNKESLSRINKLNTLTTGIIGGVVLPLIIYFILYYAKVQDVRFTLFSNKLVFGNIIPVMISHCILPNLLLFFLFNNIGWLQASKGVLGTTVVLTLVIFGIKLIFSVL